MAPKQPPIAVRFSLRGLLLAVTTCAIAFGILRAGQPVSLIVLAYCVPFFWLGVATLIVGDAIASVENSLAGIVGSLVIVLGMMVAGWAAVAGGVGVVIFVLWVILSF